jgi:hypothetical protein
VAVTVAPVVELSPVDGLQVYDGPPEAVRVPVLPGQIVVLFTEMVGVAFTVRDAVAVLEHEPVVPLTVYSTDEVALLVTTDPVVALRPVDGLQLYEVAPLAVKVAVLPEQIVAVFTVTVGVGFTVSDAVALDVHVPVVPVTV